MSTIVNDIKYAIRQLIKSPGFAVVALTTLAIGIGANTALFSVINAVLLRALPFDHPEKIVQLWSDPSGVGKDRNSVAAAEFEDWRDQATTLEDVSAVRRVNLNLTDEGRPERLDVLQASAGYFHILRITPLLGRDFLPDEDHPGKDKVVMLTHQFWQRYFGGDRNLIGHPLRLGDDHFTVVGILPPQPQLPHDCDVVIPFVFGSESWHHNRRDNRLRVIARLAPGVTLNQARLEMQAIQLRLKPLSPEYKQNWGIRVVPLQEDMIGWVRTQLWILFGSVGLVLLIACANVAGLLLAKIPARQKEMALRMALGARRRHVVRQLLTESMMLSLLSGGLGVFLAFWMVAILKQWNMGLLPRAEEIAVNGSVLGFALLVSMVTGSLFGLAPICQLVRTPVSQALKNSIRSSSSSSSFLRGGLLVTQIALTVILLTGSGLLLRTLYHLQSVPAGFNPDRVLALDISMNDDKYAQGQQRTAFLQRILDRIESLPGVAAAASTTTLPMSGATDNTVRAENQPDQDEYYIGSDYDFVSDHYYQAMGINLLRGRVFNERDNTTGAPRVVVINESLANQVFPHDDPVGQRVVFLGNSWEVIGLVENVHQRGLDQDRTEHIYLPQAYSLLQCSLVIRTEVPPQSLTETIRKAIFILDPDQPISNVRTLQQIVNRSIADRRLVLILLSTFSGTALLLATIGLYGIIAYSVAQRTQEIGIRMALGANASRVLRLILCKGVALTAMGLSLGVVGAFMLTRVLRSLLFDVSPTDPVTFLGVILVLASVALLACYIPARRAARIDPMEALRYE